MKPLTRVILVLLSGLGLYGVWHSKWVPMNLYLIGMRHIYVYALIPTLLAGIFLWNLGKLFGAGR